MSTHPASKIDLTIDLPEVDVIACIPAYNETEAELRNTIDSFRNSHDTFRTQLTVIVDGYDTKTIEGLQAVLKLGSQPAFIARDGFQYIEGILPESPRRIDFLVIIKDKNAGKRDSHVYFLKVLSNSVEKYQLTDAMLREMRLSILLLDSDTSFAPDAVGLLHHAMWHAKDPRICGATGFTLPRWRYRNLIEASQYHEYLITHLGVKSAQSVMGFVTCLAGAFSLCKAADLVDPYVIAQYTREPETIIDFNKLQLGEDRYLTTIFLSKDRRAVFVANSKAYTTPPETMAGLLAQRRRWVNSKLVNDMEIISRPFTTATIFRRLALWYMRFSALVDIFLVFTQFAFAFGITQSILQNLFQLSARANLIAFGIYSILFTVLIWVMTYHQPGKHPRMYYVISGALSLYNLLTMAMLVVFLMHGSLTISSTLFFATLAMLWVSAIQIGEAHFSTVYCFVAYLFLRPVFMLSALFAAPNIDDISWGTRGGVTEAAGGETMLRSNYYTYYKGFLLFGVTAMNIALGYVLMRNPAISVQFYVWVQILLGAPFMVMTVWYMIQLARARRRQRLDTLVSSAA